MPNRILRDWTDSSAFDGLPAEAERLFVRLLMKVDDFGRFHANPQLLKSACFPLAEDLRANTVAAWLTLLSDRQLVFSYTSGTGSYLAVRKFRQRARAESSKFPPPDGQPPDWMPPDDGHVAVICPSHDRHPRAYSEAEAETKTGASNAPAREPCGEVPDLKQAAAMVMADGIAADFIALAHADWTGANGCNALGRPVAWSAYVRKRWRYEAVEWRSGKHRGKASLAAASPRIGPSLRQVQGYAQEKDDGSKRAISYAVSWWQTWETRGWKRAEKGIDWQIEFSTSLQRHLQNQCRE